jgi:hypothetical protein
MDTGIETNRVTDPLVSSQQYQPSRRKAFVSTHNRITKLSQGSLGRRYTQDMSGYGTAL